MKGPMPKSLGSRLAIGYCVFMFASMLILFALFYVLASAYLRHSDRDTIRHRLAELADRYNTDGLDGLTRMVVDDELHTSRSFYVRLVAPDNQPRFSMIPDDWNNFDLRIVEASRAGTQLAWVDVPAKDDEDVLELAGILVRDGSALWVGKSSGPRQRVLETLLMIGAVVVLPLVGLAVAGGAFLAARVLRPLRAFVDTIRGIDAGAMDRRVAIGNAGDEVGELAVVFNGLLDRIETLLHGMRGALDNVAHDVRTPIARIRGIAEAALGSASGVGRLRDALADCLEESEHLLRMVNTLMDISEAETGALKLNYQDVKLRALIEDVVDIYAYVAEDKALAVSVDAPEELTLSGDESRLRQVVGNLLDNAIKYTPRGGRIDIVVSHTATTIGVLVKDTGIGISTDELPKIWDRLYRGRDSYSERGLGLGLSLVKAVVKAHHGDVTVSSVPGKGSGFLVSIPRGVHVS